MNRINIVCLGVRDMKKSVKFYREGLGFQTKEPQKVFWGGYHAYFADPDGYYWEVAYNPFVPFDENDMLQL